MFKSDGVPEGSQTAQTVPFLFWASKAEGWALLQPPWTRSLCVWWARFPAPVLGKAARLHLRTFQLLCWPQPWYCHKLLMEDFLQKKNQVSKYGNMLQKQLPCWCASVCVSGENLPGSKRYSRLATSLITTSSASVLLAAALQSSTKHFTAGKCSFTVCSKQHRSLTQHPSVNAAAAGAKS